MTAGSLPIPLTLLTGFLGAGKTTLLNRILSEPEGVRFGVLVNDFGEINIDAGLVLRQDVDQVSLANGCICCSIRDDLVAAARQLLANDPKPERIIVEASGVSRPLAIADALAADDLAGSFQMDAVLCLVDADGFAALDYASTELAIDQAACSDLVLLNKCDLASEAAIGDVERTLLGSMPGARIVRTARADVPRALLFGPRGETVREVPAHTHGSHGHDHDHDHGEEFESWSWQTSDPLDFDRFRSVVRRLPETLLRAKGIVRFGAHAQERGVFHLVGKRTSVELQLAEPPTDSVVVAIARRGALDRDALASLFASCRVTP